MNKKVLKRISLLLVVSFMFTTIFGNALVVEAATKMASNFSNALLSSDEVGKDVYLRDVLTLNNDESYVGVFVSDSNYEYYYGVSDDLLNWDLTSKYFSLVHGNGVFVGISQGEVNQLNYTKDGQEWKVADLPKDVNPMAVKFENGYFKMTSKDSDNKTHLYFSKDAETWYDITGEVPTGAKVENIVTVNDQIYSLVGTSIAGDSVKIFATSTIDESETKWNEIETLTKKGYGLHGNFSFNGKTVGVQLYSLADYEKDGYVSNKLYYVTSDFINWEEKDWTQSGVDYYSAYSSITTDTKDTAVDSKRFEAVEVLPYQSEQENEYGYYSNEYVSYIVYSNDGTTWVKDRVEIFVNGEKLTKEPTTKTNIEGLEKYEWARSGAEYVIGRNYLSAWLVTSFNEGITRGDYLELIMQALNVPEPAAPRSGYTPFTDVWSSDSLIERANRLGLTSGVGNNKFAPYDYITRQDMMVLTYNILNKLEKIEPDTGLTALQAYKDKDKVKAYAELAVSSLSKEGIIKGDGVNVKPTSNVTHAEAVVIAESLNKYRFR